MNQVKGVFRVDPLAFDILGFGIRKEKKRKKLSTTKLRDVTSTSNWQLGGAHAGCMGVRSFPITYPH